MKDYINYNQSDYPEYNSYVYWIMDKKNFKHYIGSRKSSCSDLEYDLQKYKTSSKIVKYIFNNRSEDLELIILRVFKTREEAYNYEIYLHNFFNVKENNLFYNNSNAGPFDIGSIKTFGFINAKDIDDNIFKQITCEEFHKNRENYLTPMQGKVQVLIDNKIEYVSQEEFHKNRGKYVSPVQNKVSVRLKNTNNSFKLIDIKDYNKEIYETPCHDKITVFDGETYIKVSCEEFHENREKYKTSRDDKVVAKSQEDKNYKLISKEEYYSEDYSHPSTNQVTVTIGEKHKNVPKEEYYKNYKKYRRNGNKSSKTNKNKVCVRLNGKPILVPKEESYKYDSLNGKMISVFDLNEGLTKKIPVSQYNKEIHLTSLSKEYKRLRKEKIIVYAYSVKLNKRIFVFKDKIDNINFFNIDCESREIKDYVNPAYNKVYVVNILTNENETVDKETYRNNKEKYILRNKRRKK